MMLLLDIGNTRLKWTLADQRGSFAPAQAPVHDGKPASAITQLAGSWQGKRPSAVWIAHVTGAAHEEAISAAVQSAFSVQPRYARSEASRGALLNAYTQPQRLGVDRWLAMLALWTRTQAAFCVASAGTALTFDAVDARGQHLGGVIAPGLGPMIAATLGHTRFATDNIDTAFNQGLGLDTETCVRQGALHAAAGLLDRLAARHAGQHVLAGGDADLLAPQLGLQWQVEHDLVLRGLAIVATSAGA